MRGFDDFDDLNKQESIRPFWTTPYKKTNTEKQPLVGEESREQLLTWLNNAYQTESNRLEPYRAVARKNIEIYQGGQGAEPGVPSSEASFAGLEERKRKTPKMVVNHLYDLTEQRVSRITRYKPNVMVNPASPEYEDKISARIVKQWIDYLFYITEFDRIQMEVSRVAYICGEAILEVFWDPNAGEISKDWMQLSRMQREALKSEHQEGEGELLGDDGAPIDVDKPVYVGEVGYRVHTPMTWTPQYTMRAEDRDWEFFDEWMDIDAVREKYPAQADQLKSESGDSDSDASSSDRVKLRHFYHRPNEFMAIGWYIVSTGNAILESKPLPPHQRTLPGIRLTDIDIPRQMHGMSFFQNLRNINSAINDFTTMVRRNAVWAAHPRWMIPRGSLVKRESLGNDITMIEFQGQVPPRIEPPPAMSSDLMSLRKELKGDLQQIGGVFDISRGQVPNGIKSGIAIQYLDEQENERANASVTKHSGFIRNVVLRSIELASDYYEKDDDRLIRVVGKDQQYMVKEFDPSVLTIGYDVRVSSASSLPTSRSARIQTLVELKKSFPNIIRDEQVMSFLEWGDVDKYFDAITVAIHAAEAENEDMMSGEEVNEPKQWEDHIQHWQVHVREMQQRNFGYAPPEIQNQVKLHVLATEYLMMQQARINSIVAMTVAKLPAFPIFYKLSEPDMILLDAARIDQPLPLPQIKALYEGTPSASATPAPASGGGASMTAAPGMPSGAAPTAAVAEAAQLGQDATPAGAAQIPDEEGPAPIDLPPELNPGTDGPYPGSQ